MEGTEAFRRVLRAGGWRQMLMNARASRRPGKEAVEGIETETGGKGRGGDKVGRGSGVLLYHRWNVGSKERERGKGEGQKDKTIAVQSQDRQAML